MVTDLTKEKKKKNSFTFLTSDIKQVEQKDFIILLIIK
jgi:hypothetical protein